jgi:hypothetical protein
VREILFICTRRQRNGAVPEFPRILHSEMTEAAKPLDRDGVAGHNVHFADSVEDSDAGAEEGRVFCGIRVVWDAYGGLGAEGAIFCVCR